MMKPFKDGKKFPMLQSFIWKKRRFYAYAQGVLKNPPNYCYTYIVETY